MSLLVNFNFTSYAAIPILTIAGISFQYLCRDRWIPKDSMDHNLPSSNRLLTSLWPPTRPLDDDDICPLCLDQLKTTTNGSLQLSSCNHIYCPACLSDLISRQMYTCILCNEVFCNGPEPPGFVYSVFRWNLAIFNMAWLVAYLPASTLYQSLGSSECEVNSLLFAITTTLTIAYALAQSVDLARLFILRDQEPKNWFRILNETRGQHWALETAWLAISTVIGLCVVVHMQIIVWNVLQG